MRRRYQAVVRDASNVLPKSLDLAHPDSVQQDTRELRLNLVQKATNRHLL